MESFEENSKSAIGKIPKKRLRNVAQLVKAIETGRMVRQEARPTSKGIRLKELNDNPYKCKIPTFRLGFALQDGLEPTTP